MRTVGRALFVLVFENPLDVRCPPSTLPNSLFVEDPLIDIKIRSFQCGQPASWTRYFFTRTSRSAWARSWRRSFHRRIYKVVGVSPTSRSSSVAPQHRDRFLYRTEKDTLTRRVNLYYKLYLACISASNSIRARHPDETLGGGQRHDVLEIPICGNRFRMRSGVAKEETATGWRASTKCWVLREGLREWLRKHVRRRLEKVLLSSGRCVEPGRGMRALVARRASTSRVCVHCCVLFHRLYVHSTVIMYTDSVYLMAEGNWGTA